MADPNECGDCFDPEREIVRSPQTSSRSEALSLYIRLQGQGFLPAMCQSHGGQYRVCYSEKERMANQA